MANLALIVWNQQEAEQHAAPLTALGHQVTAWHAASQAMLKQLRAAAPDVLIVDLNRLPSHGIQVALATRKTPIVFIEGDPEKTAKAKAKVPTAAYTTWKKLPSLLKNIGKLAPSTSSGKPMDLYKETPIATKLGLDKARTIVAIDAPRSFLNLLPPHIEIVDENQPASAVFCFTTDPRQLQSRIEQLAARSPVWIAWPKRAAKSASSLTMYSIREIAFSAGLVDYKICGIDSHWSAMLFTLRKPAK
ncbi:MAG: hypothetical protein JNK48_04845 [Bryobacterales bacterium]|nr:hypothetical protein [Bryobacterales bacterium]